MQQRELTPEQKSEIALEKERRRRERQRHEDQHRRHVERLRRRIAEARKRRQRMWLLFLLAMLAMQESIRSAFTRSFLHHPGSTPEPAEWTPCPHNDFAPASGKGDYCDGYSYEQWSRMTTERGICISRKAELREAWKADPDRDDFPLRYKDWGYRPYLGEIMLDLTDPRHQNDALIAIKLLSPVETHNYLEEAYATDPRDLRQCLADRDYRIISTLRQRAIFWEERKRREAEEARKEKNNPKPDDDEKTIEP